MQKSGIRFLGRKSRFSRDCTGKVHRMNGRIRISTFGVHFLQAHGNTQRFQFLQPIAQANYRPFLARLHKLFVTLSALTIVAENMQTLFSYISGNFPARRVGKPVFFCHRALFFFSREGIVISDRKQRKPPLLSPPTNLVGRIQPVRIGTV